MTKEQLAKWLKGKKFSLKEILVCPRCHRVDIDPEKHLDECDPLAEQQRQESWEHGDH